MKRIIIFIALAVAFSSCEKVIDVELNEADPKVVMEALMVEGTFDFDVSLSYTSNFFTSTTPEPITNATVTLSDDAGTSVTIAHLASGIYRIPNFTAVSDRIYTLRASLNGEVYTASAYLPPVVPIDSLKHEDQPFSGFGGEEPTQQVFCMFTDPGGIDNYYRLVGYKNGREYDSPFDLIVFDDQVSDGRAAEVPFFTRDFVAGDTVTLELRNIDAGVYDYYYTLGEILGSGGGPGAAAPANPNTNIEGGAIGYFGAMSLTRDTIVVSE